MDLILRRRKKQSEGKDLGGEEGGDEEEEVEEKEDEENEFVFHARLLRHFSRRCFSFHSRDVQNQRQHYFAFFFQYF